ncbi:unnamed protein product [Coccothraustes coccothraustes]
MAVGPDGEGWQRGFASQTPAPAGLMETASWAGRTSRQAGGAGLQFSESPEQCRRSGGGGTAAARLAAGPGEASSGCRAPEQTGMGPSLSEGVGKVLLQRNLAVAMRYYRRCISNNVGNKLAHF